MDACCANKTDAVERLQHGQSKVLTVVLVINASMFAVELIAGILAGSLALVADSLDMLGDALVYGFSLYVVARSSTWKARAAVSKAVVMGLFGFVVFAQLAYKAIYPRVPTFETMGAVGAVALAANLVCFALLWRHRSDDINMRSVWLCSRNDVFANVSVLLAAVAVWLTMSPWPDFVVGALICAVFLRSAWVVAREAREELRVVHLQNRERSHTSDDARIQRAGPVRSISSGDKLAKSAVLPRHDARDLDHGSLDGDRDFS